MTSRFERHNQAITQAEIASGVEAGRYEARYESLYAEHQPTIAVVDEIVRDYHTTIVASRLPSTLVVRSTKQLHSRHLGNQGAIFTNSWLITKGGNGLIEVHAQTILPSGELGSMEKVDGGDLALFKLIFSSPWDEEQRIYTEQLEASISIFFWSLYSTSFARNLQCCQQIETTTVPGIELFTSEPYGTMTHTVEFPIANLTPEAVGNSLLQVAPLITPFILERNPQ